VTAIDFRSIAIQDALIISWRLSVNPIVPRDLDVDFRAVPRH